MREVFEETGVRAVPLRLVGVQALPPTVYPNGDRAQYLDVILALDAVVGEAHVHDDESIDVAWRGVHDLDDAAAAPARHRLGAGTGPTVQRRAPPAGPFPARRGRPTGLIRSGRARIHRLGIVQMMSSWSLESARGGKGIRTSSRG